MAPRDNANTYRARDAKARAEGFASLYYKRRASPAERDAVKSRFINTKPCPCCDGSGRIPLTGLEHLDGGD